MGHFSSGKEVIISASFIVTTTPVGSTGYMKSWTNGVQLERVGKNNYYHPNRGILVPDWLITSNVT